MGRPKTFNDRLASSHQGTKSSNEQHRMKVNVLGDYHWESRIDRVLKDLAASGYRGLFEERDYGSGLTSLIVVVICQNPELDLKKRVVYTEADHTLSLDIMLGLTEMKSVSPEM